MRGLTWNEYLAHCKEWSYSTRASYVYRITSFESAKTFDIARIAASLKNVSASSKLINKALDAGLHFKESEIRQFELSVNETTLLRAMSTAKHSIWDVPESQKLRKRRKEEFWNEAGAMTVIGHLWRKF